MDFIDRLAGFLRNLLGDSSREKSSRSSGYQDPDLRDAWEELDDYLRGGSGERPLRWHPTGSVALRCDVPDTTAARCHVTISRGL